MKEKYAGPDELIKILQSQPKHEGALGFMEMMIAVIGLITYFILICFTLFVQDENFIFPLRENIQ